MNVTVLVLGTCWVDTILSCAWEQLLAGHWARGMFLPQGSWERKGLLRVGGPRMTCFHRLQKTGLKVTVPYMDLVAIRAASFPLSTGWTYLLVFICWKNLASMFLRVYTSLWLSKSVLKSSRFFWVIQCGWVFSFSSLCFLWPKQGLCYLCFLHTSHGLVSVSHILLPLCPLYIVSTEGQECYWVRENGVCQRTQQNFPSHLVKGQ